MALTRQVWGKYENKNMRGMRKKGGNIWIGVGLESPDEVSEHSSDTRPT